VLIIGAGGLGCEILKNLAMAGVRHIDIIDMDTIELTNLNRQFLFRASDIGKPKAVAAAAALSRRIPGLQVTAHVCAIQDKPEAWYRQFSVIVGGLDNLTARRWINGVLCAFAEVDPATGEATGSGIIPYIDGGTEGFRGSVRTVVPRVTPCFECSIDSFPPQTGFALCTIAETPRRPEHCVAYAMTIQWPKAFPTTALDKDDPAHMQWLFQHAKQRADQFGIEGVTYALTLGVSKNIIPAVASTNATVAAACALEAFKLLTACAQSLDNYWMFMGNDGLYAPAERLERNPQCLACGHTSVARPLSVSRGATLQSLIDSLRAEPTLQLTAPSLTSAAAGHLFMARPPALRAATEANLTRTLGELFQGVSGPGPHEVAVFDPVFAHGSGLTLALTLT
jgi:ubiquitin-activating enzyme E1 C